MAPLFRIKADKPEPAYSKFVFGKNEIKKCDNIIETIPQQILNDGFVKSETSIEKDNKIDKEGLNNEKDY